MRILILVPGHVIGGAEVVVRDVAEGLAAAGDKLLLAISPGEAARFLDELPQAAVPLAPDAKADGLRAVVELRRLSRRFRPDVIYSHHRWATLLSLPLRLTGGPPVVHHAHIISRPRRTTWWGDHVIAVSEAVAQAARGQGARRVTVVRNGMRPRHVSLDEVEAVHERLTTGRRPLLAFVGRLEPGKGLDVLLDALCAVPDVGLVVVGDGPLRPWLEAAVATRSLGPRVELLGWLDDPLPVIAAASCLVLPSLAEGMPISLLEAAALGTPVVATRVGGVPEIVVDGETGVLVPPGDASALATAIARVVGDPTAAAAMADRARTYVRDHHHVSTSVAGVREVLATVVSASPRP